jgi:ribonuclease D
LSTSPIVGIDTEFIREKTYFARLCLVQLATDSVCAIVDPLAIDDMSPLYELLSDPGIIKVLHAGSQDLEIFYRMNGRVTEPVFDTQVAATLAGFPQQVGYGALVHEMLGVKLDKGDSYTDWARRPLSETQVEYALNDVRYLPEMYRQLSSQLDANSRSGWLAADFARMADESTYLIVPEDQWRRVKRISSLNRRQLALAREVAAWREREAMRRDVPKRWVLGDEGVIEVARRSPRSYDELVAIRGVTDKLGRTAAAELLAAVTRGLDVPEEELPSLKKRRRPAGDIDATVDLIAALVRKRARENDVAMPLLASRDDMERLAAGECEGSPLLEGWRGAMVGEEIRRLIDGEIALRLEHGELMVEEHRA